MTDVAVVDKVKRDLNALRLLERYFGIVSSEYGEQIAQMEAWVKTSREKAQTQASSVLFEDFLSNIDLEQFLDSSFYNSSPRLSSSSPTPSDSSQELTSRRFYEMFMDDLDQNGIF